MNSGLPRTPIRRNIHRVVQYAQKLDSALGMVHPVQKEVARRPTGLADVEEPRFRRKALAVMAEIGLRHEMLARLGNERAIARQLQFAELDARPSQDRADVRFRGLGENESHGSVVAFAPVEESVELRV